jgi:lipopolysaccharide transport system ATP-binding protein
MKEPIIRVENLSKVYRIGMNEAVSLSRWQSFKRTVMSPFDYLLTMVRDPEEEETLWAIRDVSFTVQPGEVLGIIGKNGAGKSTLLKILSQITEPTEGLAVLNGRVGSLLEVGTGFHPELTGRENVYLNGAILGMRKVEIDDKFDEMIAFSGIEKFLDTPVKRYSSGMRVRLAFSIAAHLDPEILLIDEVLAVGDAAFQRKCLGKMGNIAEEGRTVLFVSHNMPVVAALCERTIVMKDGTIVYDGPTSTGVNRYLLDSTQATSEAQWQAETLVESEIASLCAVRIKDTEGRLRSDYSSREPITIEMDVLIREWQPGFRVGLEIETDLLGTIFKTVHNDMHDDIEAREMEPGLYCLSTTIPGDLLNSNLYYATPTLGLQKQHRIETQERCVRFNVELEIPNPTMQAASRPGVVAPILPWQWQHQHDHARTGNLATD